MKKFLATLVFSLVFVLAATSQVGAVNTLNFAGSPSANFETKLRANVSGQVAKKLAKVKTEVREKVASQAAQFREKRKGVVKDRLTKVLNHLDNVAQRLDVIAEKIQARINKLKEKGVDVASMQVALDGCGTTKSALAAAITDSKTKVALVTDNGDADGSARAALASVKSAFESGKNHHKCLVAVIVILRASAPKEATSNGN